MFRGFCWNMAQTITVDILHLTDLCRRYRCSAVAFLLSRTFYRLSLRRKHSTVHLKCFWRKTSTDIEFFRDCRGVNGLSEDDDVTKSFQSLWAESKTRRTAKTTPQIKTSEMQGLWVTLNIKSYTRVAHFKKSFPRVFLVTFWCRIFWLFTV